MSGHNRKKEQQFGPSKKGSRSRKKGHKCGPSKEGFGTPSKPPKPLLGDVTLADYANASILPGRGRLPKAKATFDVLREVKHLSIEDKALDKKLVEFEGDFDFYEGNEVNLIAAKGAGNRKSLDSRKQIIEIRGIPAIQNEDIYRILEDIAKALGINYNRDTIFFAHRLPRPRSNPSPPNILVQFTSKLTKAMWIASGKQKKLKTTDLSSSLRMNLPKRRIFIEEYLRPLEKLVLGRAKSYVREGHLVSAWTLEGKIFVRRSPDSTAVRVRTLSEVESVVAVKDGRSGEDAVSGEELRTFYEAAAAATTAALERNSESAKSKAKQLNIEESLDVFSSDEKREEFEGDLNFVKEINEEGEKAEHLNIEDKAWDEKLEEFEGDFDFVKEVNEEGKEVFVMKKMLDESIADKGASKSYPLHSNNQIIEIRGVPMLENEDIYYILEEIAKALGINYNRGTISKAHRLPAPRGNPCPPNILVQFTSKSTKAMWIASGKQKQLSATYLSSSFSQSPIVIYEQLTPLKKAILGLAKSYVREGLLESSSVREGEIFVRRSPDSAAVRVRSVSEVESVVGVVSGEGAGGGTAAATVTTAAPEKNSESAKSKVKHLNIEDKAWDEQLEEFEGDFDFVKEVNEEGEEVFVMKKTSDILGKKTLGDSIADKGASKSYPLHSNNQIIEIKGIPKTENEDIYHILEEIAKTLGIKYNRDTIFLAHRLPAPRGNPFPPSIVVQFTCKSTKDTWAAFGKDKRLRDLSSSLRPEQIFIVEHLTPLKKAVLGLAKSYVREGQLESSSVRQGEIFVRRSPDSAAVRVRSVSDVESVVGVVSGKGAGGGTAAATTTTGKKKKKKRATCPVRIFDEEDLTLLNRAILERAKSYVWEGSLESAWVQEGEIFVCRSQNSAAVVVRSVSEVESVVAVKDGRSGEDAGGSGSGKIVVHRSPDPAAVRVQSVSEVESVVAVKDGRSGEDAGGSGDGAAVVVATTPATTSGKKKMKKLMTTDQSPSLCSGSGGNLAVAMSTMVASTSGKKKKKKKLTTTDLSSPLVENQLPIVENLTPLNRVVLEHAKLCVREGQLASAWVQEGEVSACRSLDSAAVRLSEVESVVAVKGGRSAEDAGGSGSNTGAAIATTAASASGKKKKKKQPRTMDLLSSLRPAPIFVEENQTPLNTAVLEHPKSYAAVEKNSESAISMDKNTLNQIRLSAALRGQPGPV